MSSLVSSPIIPEQPPMSDAARAAAHPDDPLVAAARRGCRDAFGRLAERYSERLFNVALRITRNREDAEDAVQEALVRAMIYLRDFNGESQFSTWLTRIAINSALMKLRKNRKYREIVVDDSLDAEPPASDLSLVSRPAGPDELYREEEQSRTVGLLIAGLRPKLREIVSMYYLQERTVQDAARHLGISVAAAKARLFHARAALRRSPTARRLLSSYRRDAPKPLTLRLVAAIAPRVVAKEADGVARRRKKAA